MATFDDIWRRVVLHVPSASLFLAQDWVQEAYAEACTRRNWSHLRSDTTLRTKVAKTGTVTLVQDSLSVTGGTLLFAATDVGRQFRLGVTVPIYTIVAVSTTGGTSATLDRVYAGASGAGVVCTIVDAYMTMPANFKVPDLVVDPSRWWMLRLWVSPADLNRWDPIRSAGGPPRALVSATLAPEAATATAGQVRYELWPYSAIEAYWPMIYYRNAETLAAGSQLRGAFAQRSDALIDGALWRAALWPGDGQVRNPYFNLALAAKHEEIFESKLNVMQVMDEDVYPTWLQPERYTDAPLDAAWLQQTDYAVGYSYP